jgi:hypothetical protein
LLHGPGDEGDDALRRENYGTEVDPARQAPERAPGMAAAAPDDPAVGGGGFDKPLHVEGTDTDRGFADAPPAEDVEERADS